MTQDSTIMGYQVLRMAADLSEDACETILSDFAGLGMNLQLDSAGVEVWYTPELPTAAGPYMIGLGLTGIVPHALIDASLSGSSLVVETSARKIATALDSPVVPPIGTPIEMGDYLQITQLNLDVIMRQARDMQ